MRWMSDLSEVPTIVDMSDYEYIYAVKFASLINFWKIQFAFYTFHFY